MTVEEQVITTVARHFERKICTCRFAMQENVNDPVKVLFWSRRYVVSALR